MESITKEKVESRKEKRGVRRGEWSELGSRDIDHTTRGARLRERDANESIRPLTDQNTERVDF
jgi:hypothetical protein